MRQMQSTVREDATVLLALAEVARPTPREDEVVVEMQAAPINPSDLGTMFAGADMDTLAPAEGHTGVVAKLSSGAMKAAGSRMGLAIAVGNEGSGVVVEAGASSAAQALLGRMVAVRGGAMYADYRCIAASDCLAMPAGTSARACASSFVNPLTALGMVETMRLEGHRALVHTAAASNLGQMLQKICLADGVELVNIVRSPSQAALLQDIGARFVCDTSSESFLSDLTDALEATGATVAFDATGGGRLASDILTAMEAALGRQASGFSRYGTATHKQVYLYGNLQLGATTLNRVYGMAWGVGGWLLTHFLTRVGPEAGERLGQRVAAEIDTTFASHYSDTVSLEAALEPASVRDYVRKATGKKYLIELGAS